MNQYIRIKCTGLGDEKENIISTLEKDLNISLNRERMCVIDQKAKKNLIVRKYRSIDEDPNNNHKDVLSLKMVHKMKF